MPRRPEQPTVRCPWCGDDPLYVDYHDREWGVPVRDDRTLFEFLTLEGAQAGLSWLTILRKREAYRRAFVGFDPVAIASWGDEAVARLMADPGIVRNRLKIEAAIGNARAFLDVQRAFGSFADYIWGFVDGRPIQGSWTSMTDVPPPTPLAETISRDLKRRGFRFVGPTIVYAHMQATGLVNDHLVGCFRHRQVAALGGS
jgi:DNA-3-methyladenine glycosylase I